MFRRAAVLTLLAAALAACGGGTNTDPDAGTPDAGGNDTQAPTMVGTQPADGASGVAAGSAIVVTFSEAMDKESVQVTLSPAASLGSASWTTGDTVVSYVPQAELSPSTTYTVTVSGKDVAGNSLSGTATFSFTTEASDTTAPTVLSTQPEAGASGVAAGSAIVVTFSEPMDTATVQVTLSPAVSLGSASWNAEHTVASYTPEAELSLGTTYSMTVSGKDVAGNSLSGTASFDFTTVVPDTTPPTVSATTPAAGATDVDPMAGFSITFSEAMDTGTVTVDIAPAVELQVSWNATGTTLTALPPQAGLAYDTQYTVTVGGSDMAGNALAGTGTFSFTTATPPDTTPPTVSSSSPADGATSVSVSTNISLSFSESMDRLSVENALTLSPEVTCTFAWNTASKLVTCIPASPLAFSTAYTVTLGTGAEDLAGNALAAEHSFSFQTAAAPDTTRPTITGSTPANGSRGSTRGTSITVVFSEPMNKASAQTAFTITSPTGFNAGTFSWNTAGTEMTFNPDSDFAYGTFVSWSVSTAAEDLAGNTLVPSAGSSFRVAYLGTKSLLVPAYTLDAFVHNDELPVYSPGSSTLLVGDYSTGKYSRSFLGFDLGQLTGTVARINSATLYLYQSSTTGAPTTELGTFWVQSVDFGASLGFEDFNTPVLQTYQYRFVGGRVVYGLYNEESSLAVATIGQKSVVVTRKVQDDWANRTARGLRSQFRLRFNTDVTYDGNGDYVVFNSSGASSNVPYLYVEYESEYAP